MLHTNSLSLSLFSFSQISNPTVRSSHHPSCCCTHNPNPRQKCESRQKKEEKKNPPSKPTKLNPTATDRHSLTASFTKLKFLCKISCCEWCSLLQRHTQWPEKKYPRGRDLPPQGKYKESRRTQILQQKPKKKTETKNSLQRKIQILPQKN